jgi:hypothetical protein
MHLIKRKARNGMWNGQDARNKDSSRTHVLNSKQHLGDPQWNRKIIFWGSNLYGLGGGSPRSVDGMLQYIFLYTYTVAIFIGVNKVVLPSKISSPDGILTAELTALFVALRHIEEVLQLPKKCLLLHDRLSSSVRALLPRKTLHQTSNSSTGKGM